MIYRAIKAVAAFALLVAVASVIGHAVPGLVGADYSYVVQSGSMEPAIGTGSVVFVQDVPVERIEEGEVVTYRMAASSTPTTHRVIEKQQRESSVRFVTKGDANEDPDPQPVYPSNIVGVVTLTIPVIGYVVGFAQTQLGWLTLVVVPVVVLITSELWTLYAALEPVEDDES